jgi:acetoin utilization deacetylase AcuC-like enzyme
MVHSPMYLRQLKERASEAALAISPKSATAKTPKSRSLVFETDSGISDDNAKKDKKQHKSAKPPLTGAFGASSLEQNGIAMDTYVSAKSWDVARAAAGTVCLAVDRVVRKEYHNAVCLVRPPGHHVGRHGRTETAPSSGFCLLNNVVIGATHARMYPWIRKVAVLDWDIHHGNGTEELLKGDPDAFFASIHLYSAGHYFPGTGKARDDGRLINVALENSGSGSGSLAFREALTDKVLPAMKAFRPDIIFISAGFDGHRDDILGGVAAVKDPNVPAGYVEEDYAWATQQVLQLAGEVCDGRVVSVLEGGYDVRKETNALAKSVAAHISSIATFELALKQEAETKAAVASASAEVAVKQEGGLLAKLLATDLSDAGVIVIDEEEEAEGGAEHPHDAKADGDSAVEDETGDEEDEEDEEDGDVAMDDAEVAVSNGGEHAEVVAHDELRASAIVLDSD